MTAGAAGHHEPVMVAEMLEALRPRDRGRYVDGTFGGGGHSRAILNAADCTVWAIDRDPEAAARGAKLVREFDGRLAVMEGRFGDMDELLAEHGVTRVDGIALDLGVSAMQLTDPARGFSFRHDGPLDMRQELRGASAEDFVNDSDEATLADVIFRFGGERRARRIAAAIADARGRQRITTTGQLAAIVRSAHGTAGHQRLDPATRTFQAIRIVINREIEELGRGLRAAEVVLAPGGRLAVISFHSLEDGLVKGFLRKRSGVRRSVSRHAPAPPQATERPTFRPCRGGARKPSQEEIRRNPRARSARLRIAERLADE